MSLWIAVGLFIVAALFGLKILSAILKNHPTPKSAVFTHGPVAALAVAIVIYHLFKGPVSPLLITSVVLFISAGLGGLTLFISDMKGKPVSKAIALIHPFVAGAGLVALILYLLHQ